MFFKYLPEISLKLMVTSEFGLNEKLTFTNPTFGSSDITSVAFSKIERQGVLTAWQVFFIPTDFCSIFIGPI